MPTAHIDFDKTDELYFVMEDGGEMTQTMKLHLDVLYEMDGWHVRLECVIGGGVEVLIGTKWFPLAGFGIDVSSEWLKRPKNVELLKERIKAREERDPTRSVDAA